jgi:hypothetical protein
MLQFGTFKAELGGQFKISKAIPNPYSTFGRETLYDVFQVSELERHQNHWPSAQCSDGPRAAPWLNEFLAHLQSHTSEFSRGEAKKLFFQFQAKCFRDFIPIFAVYL